MNLYNNKLRNRETKLEYFYKGTELGTKLSIKFFG